MPGLAYETKARGQLVSFYTWSKLSGSRPLLAGPRQQTEEVKPKVFLPRDGALNGAQPSTALPWRRLQERKPSDNVRLFSSRPPHSQAPADAPKTGGLPPAQDYRSARFLELQERLLNSSGPTSESFCALVLAKKRIKTAGRC